MLDIITKTSNIINMTGAPLPEELIGDHRVYDCEHDTVRFVRSVKNVVFVNNDVPVTDDNEHTRITIARLDQNSNVISITDNPAAQRWDVKMKMRREGTAIKLAATYLLTEDEAAWGALQDELAKYAPLVTVTFPDEPLIEAFGLIPYGTEVPIKILRKVQARIKAVAEKDVSRVRSHGLLYKDLENVYDLDELAMSPDELK